MMKQWDFISKSGLPILVRHAERDDAKILHEGFRSVVEEGQWLPTFSANSNVGDWMHWIDKTQHSSEVLLVAFLEHEYAGHLTLQPEEWNASSHVAKLGIIVRMECRNQGVGRSLMTAAEEAALDNGYGKIILSTFHDNSAARHLYTSLGFRTVGIRMKHFDMPKGFIDEVLMEKELDATTSRVL
jgi:ribosomal protein S18 acetylase RimI-like enzyme